MGRKNYQMNNIEKLSYETFKRLEEEDPEGLCTACDLIPQVQIGRYRADFVYASCVIEIDGHEFHKTKEQRRMVRDCRESLVGVRFPFNERPMTTHDNNEIELFEDNKKYPDRVAQAWNKLINVWRGKDYDYLMIIASDTIADPDAIDYMVKCAEENPQAGMITGKVERNLKRFKSRLMILK